MSHGHNSVLYFFDFPLSDIYCEACSGIKLIYYGNESGFFGANKHKPVDLDNTAAIRIKIKHQTVEPLSDKYDYSIVYFNKNISKLIWSTKHRNKHASLRKLSRRVHLKTFPSLKPKFVKFRLFSSEKPIYLAGYDSVTPLDNYVPEEYVQKLHDKFQSFLMRSESEHKFVTDIFDAMGLNITNKREVNRPFPNSPSVITFSVT